MGEVRPCAYFLCPPSTEASPTDTLTDAITRHVDPIPATHTRPVYRAHVGSTRCSRLSSVAARSSQLVQLAPYFRIIIYDFCLILLGLFLSSCGVTPCSFNEYNNYHHFTIRLSLRFFANRTRGDYMQSALEKLTVVIIITYDSDDEDDRNGKIGKKSGECTVRGHKVGHG